MLESRLYGNTLESWLIAAAVFVGTAAFVRALQSILVRRVARWAKRTETPADDLVAEVLGRTKFFFFLLVGLHFASLGVTLPERTEVLLRRLVVIGVLLQGGIWAAAAVTFWVSRYRDRMLDRDAATATTVSALGFVGRLGVWTLVVLLILDNLQVDITALVTGLGIGGVAVALAVQNILGDLFASLSIVLDKPFVIGDVLNVDGLIGKVEHIGLKTTRVRSLSGEQLVFSNSDLLTSRIRNFGRLFERRMLFTIGVTYDTPPETVERIPGWIREIVEAQEHVRFDRSHFKEYGDSALLFETVYYVLKPDYALAMDIQQQVNLELLRRFGELGIEFAFPTRTLFVRSLEPEPRR